LLLKLVPTTKSKIAKASSTPIFSSTKVVKSSAISIEIYAQNYGDDFSDYVEFASENYGDGNLADTNNNNLGNTPAEIQRNQKLVDNNNPNN
jgi:hypothetical protein